MVTILFVLGIAAALGVAVWTSRRATGTRPSGSNRYLGGSGVPYYGDTDHRHHSDGGDGGGWSGGDGGGWSGGGGDGGGGGGGGS